MADDQHRRSQPIDGEAQPDPPDTERRSTWRKLTTEDLPDLASWLSEPEVARWWYLDPHPPASSASSLQHRLGFRHTIHWTKP